MMVKVMMTHLARVRMAEVTELINTAKAGKDLALEDQAMTMPPAVTMITTEATAPGTRSHHALEGEVMVTARTARTTDDQACLAVHPLTAETRDEDAKDLDSEVRMEPAATMTTTMARDDPATTLASMATTEKAPPSAAEVTTKKIKEGEWTTTATRRATHSRGATAKRCSEPETSKRVRKRSTEGPRTARGTAAARSSDAATAVHFTATTTTSTGRRTAEKTTLTVEMDHFLEERCPSMANPVMRTVDPEEKDPRSTAMTLLAGVDHRSAAVAAAEAAKTALSSRSS